MYHGGRMKAVKKDKMMRGGGMLKKDMPMMMAGGKLEKKRFKKGGKVVDKVMIPAPKGHHWMDEGGRFYLMAHGDKFVPHKGAMLEAPFEIREAHSKG